MTILITGATGAVGRHVVDKLLRSGTTVRALTRDPAAAALPAGVQIVHGDMGDPATISAAIFDGVDAVFVFPAGRGVDDFVEKAVASGVHRFVVLSSLAAAAEHPRDIGSASYTHHRAVEEAVTSRTDEWTILRPGTFANNLLSWAYPITGGFPIRAPYLGAAQAPIHEADVADVAVAALLAPSDHRGAIHPVTGPAALTRTAQIDAIGNAIGRTIQVVEITPDQFRAEMSALIPDTIIDMLLAYWSDTVATPDVVRSIRHIVGHDGRSLDTWAHDHRADFSATVAA